jgi:hypothetical protein
MEWTCKESEGSVKVGSRDIADNDVRVRERKILDEWY